MASPCPSTQPCSGEMDSLDALEAFSSGLSLSILGKLLEDQTPMGNSLSGLYMGDSIPAVREAVTACDLTPSWRSSYTADMLLKLLDSGRFTQPINWTRYCTVVSSQKTVRDDTITVRCTYRFWTSADLAPRPTTCVYTQHVLDDILPTSKAEINAVRTLLPVMIRSMATPKSRVRTAKTMHITTIHRRNPTGCNRDISWAIRIDDETTRIKSMKALAEALTGRSDAEFGQDWVGMLLDEQLRAIEYAEL